MSMPMPMPDTRGYTPASMPSYGLSIPQKPRKHVTFANPIAEYRLVPSTASSAPERSHAVLEGPPVAGGRRRRDSISLHHDRRQGLAGSYGSHSMVASGGHGLASVADYSGHPALFNGYTVHPASNSSAMASGHKRRANGNRQVYGADTTKPPVLRGNDTRKSHIATSAVSHRHAPPCQPRLYDVFSLSSEHLPLYA
ncbi:hypothetical protein IWQ56_004808 [Coemansia nantahalensis]|nr:hypothetical protein IWQ56_004808 [Coemansia nantahalensis]